jgi:hypothetical protein
MYMIYRTKSIAPPDLAPPANGGRYIDIYHDAFISVASSLRGNLYEIYDEKILVNLSRSERIPFQAFQQNTKMQ